MQPVQYKVAVPQMYFPERLRARFTQAFEVVHVFATSRTEAAELAWEKFGERWLSLMSEPKASRQIISLYVNDPARRALWNRLQPIRVFERAGTKGAEPGPIAEPDGPDDVSAALGRAARDIRDHLAEAEWSVAVEDGYVKVRRGLETICAGVPDGPNRVRDIEFTEDRYRTNNRTRQRAMRALREAGWR